MGFIPQCQVVAVCVENFGMLLSHVDVVPFHARRGILLCSDRFCPPVRTFLGIRIVNTLTIPLLLPVINKSNLRLGFINGKVICW